jgi:hypothetical protein
MKRFPLLALPLVATLGVACSSPSQEGAPASTEQARPRRRLQAVQNFTLVETAVSAQVQAAAGTQATVRAFHLEGATGEVLITDLMLVALDQGSTDPLKNWQQDPEHPVRNVEETREALKYLDTLLPTLEAEVGTGEAYVSGYSNWWERDQTLVDTCRHGDFYVLLFRQAGKVFVIEAAGSTEC